MNLEKRQAMGFDSKQFKEAKTIENFKFHFQ
jgi:hypothetical protein